MNKVKTFFSGLVGLSVLFVLVRVLYLTFLNPYFFAQFGDEELYRGMVAKELLTGLQFDFLDYRPDTFQGAWFIVSLGAAFLFKCLGESLFVLKMVALSYQLLALIFWYFILARNGNRRTAHIFSFLFIFAPPSLMINGLTTLGDQAELLSFTAVAVFFFFEALRDGPKKLTYFLLSGISIGLGLWWNYALIITLFSLLLFWLIHERKKVLPRAVLFFSMGLVFGFIPWIIISQEYLSGIFDIRGDSLLSHFGFHNVIEAFTHYRHFVVFNLMRSFSPTIWGFEMSYRAICMLLFSGLFITPMMFHFRKKTAPSAIHVFLIFYTAIFLAVLQLSDFQKIRFFLPLFPVLFALTAIAVDQLAKPKLFILAILGVWSVCNGPLFSLAHVGTAFSTKGYRYTHVESTICKNIQPCLEHYAEWITGLNPEDVADLSYALAYKMALDLDLNDLEEETLKLDPMIPARLKSLTYYFLGGNLIEETQSLKASFENISFLENISQESYRWTVRGILDGTGYSEVIDIEYLEKIKTSWNQKHVEQAVVAHKAFHIYFPTERFDSFLDQVKEEARNLSGAEPYSFWQSIGKFLYHLWSASPLKQPYASTELEILDEKIQKPLFEGVGKAWAERDFTWRIAPKSWYLKEFAQPLQKENQKTLLESKASFQEEIFKFDVNR